MNQEPLPQIHLIRDTDLSIFAYELHIFAGDFLRECEFNMRSLATNTGADSIAIMGKNHMWLFNYLRANGIYSLEDLESRVSEHSAATESLKKTLDEQTARMKAIKQLYDSSAAFQRLKPVYDGLQKIKFEKPRAKYKAEHEAELIQFYAARRKLTGEFPDGKVDMKKLSDEYDALEQAHETTYGEFKAVRDDLHRLWKVKSCVDTAARFNERTEEQKLQNRPQTRQEKEELSR